MRLHRLAVGGDVVGHGIDRLVASVVRKRPTASKFSSAKPSGLIVTWQPMHAVLLVICVTFSRIVSDGIEAVVLELDRLRRRLEESAEHIPREKDAAVNRRRALVIGMHREKERMSDDPGALRRIKFHRHETRCPVGPSHAVEFREARH